jgi:hypothetical protein
MAALPRQSHASEAKGASYQGVASAMAPSIPLCNPERRRMIPAVGLSSDDGHGMLYEDIPAWEDDVFKFLDQYVKP